MMRMRALQDDCWDQVCPFAKHGNIKEQKISCLHNSSKAICECCKERNLPDCKVLVPDVGLVEMCKENYVSPYRFFAMYNGEGCKKSMITFTGTRGWDE